jgi:hypothetical protein
MPKAGAQLAGIGESLAIACGRDQCVMVQCVSHAAGPRKVVVERENVASNRADVTVAFANVGARSANYAAVGRTI